MWQRIRLPRMDWSRDLGEISNTGQFSHISLQVQEASPRGITSGRAAHALFTRQELTKDEYGVGVHPWLDCTSEGEDDVILPEGDEVKEATLLFMRNSTSIALSTTVGSMEVRMTSLLEGKAGPLQNSPSRLPGIHPVGWWGRPSSRLVYWWLIMLSIVNGMLEQYESRCKYHMGNAEALNGPQLWEMVQLVQNCLNGPIGPKLSKWSKMVRNDQMVQNGQNRQK